MKEFLDKLENLAHGVNLAASRTQQVVNWLRWYGWLRRGDSLPDVLARVQEAFQLHVTGDLTPSLMRMIDTPRCGCPDILNLDEFPEHSQYQVQSLVLQGEDTTVFLDSSVNTLIRGEDSEFTRRTILDAMNLWSRVCNVRFVETADRASAHILVKSHSRTRDGFGTTGNVLADAHLLHVGQQVMRIDTAESWWHDFRRGYISLRQVVAHEAGHLINLDHETRRVKALMLPMYSEEFDGIQPPDTERAVHIWGTPPTDTAPQPTPPAPEPDEKITIIRVVGNHYNVEVIR